jgi:hypothetical protein
MGYSRFSLILRSIVLFSMLILISGCGGGGGGGSADTDNGQDPGGGGATPGIPTGSSYERLTEYTYNNTANEVTNYTITIKNAAGLPLLEIEYDSSGADNTWYTADDIVSEYTKVTFDAQGRYLQWTIYSGMGADGKWFTSDDMCTYLMKTVQENGNTWRYAYYSDPGTDKLWGTSDDVVMRYFDITYDASYRMTVIKGYEAGADATFFTVDDLLKSYETNSYNGAGKVLREVYSDEGPGADGIWYTADDRGLDYTAYSYDENGRLLRRTEYRYESYTGSGYILGIGPDRTWFTADDIPEDYYTYDYDANGRKIHEYSCSSAGSDGVWFTGDDIKTLNRGYTYSADGSLLQEVDYYSAGQDGTFGTSDDLLNEKTEYLKQLTIPSGSGGADSTPPSIVTSSPADNAIDINVNLQYISITLSEGCIFYQSMATFNGISALNLPNSGGSGQYIGISLASFTPLSPYTTYTLTITGLMDKSGNVMPTKTISFTTGAADTIPPSITSSYPASGAGSISRNLSSVNVYFSEPIIFDSSMIEILPVIPGMDSSRISCSYSTVTIDLTGITLAANQGYEFNFTGVKDLSNNIMPTDTVWFTTGN